MGTERRSKRAGVSRGLWLPGVLLILVTLYPMVRLVWTSFQGPGGGFSVAAYQAVIGHPLWGQAWRNTGIVMGASTLLAVVVGTAGAILTERTDLSGKRGLRLLFLMPMFIPSYVLSIAWLQWAGAEGLLNALPFYSFALSWLGGGLGGICVVMGASHVPVVYLLVAAALHAVPGDYGRAARISGAGPWKAFLTAELPLLMPAVASSALISAAGAMDNFGIPAFLGIPQNVVVLATFLYQLAIGLGPGAFRQAAALATLMAMLAVLLVLLQGLGWRSARYRLTGPSSPKPPLPLGRGKIPAVFGLGLWLVLTAVGPLVALLLTSVTPAYGVPLTWKNITTEHYLAVWYAIPAVLTGFWNSLSLSIPTALLVLFLARPIGKALARGSAPAARGLDILGVIPYALPGMVIALAVLLTYWRPWPGVDLAVSGWILLLAAYIARFFTLGVRVWVAAWVRVTPELEEAARISGASEGKTLRHIMFPLLRRDVMGGVLLIAMFAFTELTVSSLLAGADGMTIGMALFNLESGGYTLESAALGTILTVLSTGAAALMMTNPASGAIYGERGVSDGIDPHRRAAQKAVGGSESPFNADGSVRG
ncbi:binding-protein-dependent transport systems inner membrane component [Kyrpidia tusciae DSM 2912]|uniref:Binding-protein-dependent transport systems inner membrane component n=1 Tax=Kyrpidia tusciae (strain DSM 2912 / NBRC 15312 / T2) TaxID=562970 RepID=D5WXB6_KYRT2|nr:binding-protein-dependent transport systems inner membrane component [Kyrpidia tusciae DSM 2912]